MKKVFEGMKDVFNNVYIKSFYMSLLLFMITVGALYLITITPKKILLMFVVIVAPIIFFAFIYIMILESIK